MGIRGNSAIYLLAVAFAVASFGASAADPDIAGVWGSAWGLKHPARDLYVATSKPLGYSGKQHTEPYAQYDVWGKFLYDITEDRGDKALGETWVAMHLDCAKKTYIVYRYMEFDEQGNVLLDSPKIERPKPIPSNAENPDHLPLAELTAIDASHDACVPPPSL